MFSRTPSQRYFDTHFHCVHKFLGAQKNDNLSETTAASKIPIAIESNAIVRMLCCRSETVEEHKAYSIPANLD